MRWRHLILAALAIAAPAVADTLTISKSATIVSDTLGNLIPRSMPGSVVDYRVTLSNPASNLGKPVRNMQMDDPLPANVILRVSDIATAGKGPVEFVDGGLLGLGASALTCTFVSLSSTTDCIDFYDGTSWTYTPVPDVNGYDANVRAIRVRPVTTFATGGSFQLRYRVKIR
jgi:hypothetical protein